MINFNDGTIVQGDKIELITSWAVWFRTPMGGLYVNLSDAVRSIEKIMEADPQMLVWPVPVAIGSTTYEEALRR